MINRLIYWKRIFSTYILGGKNNLSFWHGEPRINDLAVVEDGENARLFLPRRSSLSQCTFVQIRHRQKSVPKVCQSGLKLCQKCVKVVSELCQNCVKTVIVGASHAKIMSTACQNCTKVVPKLCQNCVKAMATAYQRCAKVVPKLCQNCAKYLPNYVKVMSKL